MKKKTLTSLTNKREQNAFEFQKTLLLYVDFTEQALLKEKTYENMRQTDLEWSYMHE